MGRAYKIVNSFSPSAFLSHPEVDGFTLSQGLTPQTQSNEAPNQEQERSRTELKKKSTVPLRKLLVSGFCYRCGKAVFHS